MTCCRGNEKLGRLFILPASKTPASKPSIKKNNNRKNPPYYITVKLQCREIDLGNMCLSRLEYTSKSEGEGLILQRALRIYGTDRKTESAV